MGQYEVVNDVVCCSTKHSAFSVQRGRQSTQMQSHFHNGVIARLRSFLFKRLQLKKNIINYQKQWFVRFTLGYICKQTSMVRCETKKKTGVRGLNHDLEVGVDAIQSPPKHRSQSCQRFYDLPFDSGFSFVCLFLSYLFVKS